MKNLIETAGAAGQFTTLLAAVKAVGLTDMLSGTSSYTVFAPTDAAFRKLPAGTFEALLKDIPRLRSIVKYHIVATKLAAREIRPGDLKTLEGSPLNADVAAEGLTVNGQRVTGADIAASNGVIHVVDSVLQPPGQRLAAVA